MIQEHPITPTPKLVEQWSATIYRQTEDDDQRDLYIATQAARWGADQELDACCKWLMGQRWQALAIHLRAARRPKPTSLKEQALEALDEEHADMRIQNYKLIRSVLESLPD